MPKSKWLGQFSAALICLVISQLTLEVLADSNEILTIADSTIAQTFTCSASSSSGCLFQFTPATTTTCVIEATVYFPTVEGTSVSSQSTPPYALLLCNKSTNECDYPGQYLKLRNLSISGTFTAATVYSFSLLPLTGETKTLSVSFTIHKDTSCVNDTCGSNGTCSVSSNGLGQCICNSTHGAKNCQAVLQEISPNTETNLSIASLSSSLVKFSFDVSAASLLESNQLTLVLIGSTNPSCYMYFLDSNSQTNNEKIFSFQDTSLDVNSLFSTTSSASSRMLRTLSTQNALTSQYNFNLILLISNQSAAAQAINLQLHVTPIASKSKSDHLFLYFVIGMSILAVIVILTSGFYFFQRRRICAQRALQQAILEGLQNNINTQQKYQSKKQDEDFEAFFSLFCEIIPSKPMTSSEQTQIHRQSIERKITSNNKACTCSICLSTIEIGNNFRTSMCNHYFHSACLDAWIKKQRNCPMCRTPHDKPDLEKFVKNGRVLQNYETVKVQGQHVTFEMVDNPGYCLIPTAESLNVPNSILQGTRQQQQQQSFQIGKRVTFKTGMQLESAAQKDKSSDKIKIQQLSSSSQIDFRLSNNLKTAASSTIQGSSLTPLDQLDSSGQFSIFGSSNFSNNSILIGEKPSSRLNLSNSSLKIPQHLSVPQYTFDKQQAAQAQYMKTKFNNMPPPMQIILSPSSKIR